LDLSASSFATQAGTVDLAANLISFLANN